MIFVAKWHSMTKRKPIGKLFSPANQAKAKRFIDERNKNIDEKWHNLREEYE